MRHPLRRYYGFGDLHFITASCYQRRPLLGSAPARDEFVGVLDEIRMRHGFLLIGYVVMPEHVHLLLTEPAIGDVSKAVQVVKQNVCRNIGLTNGKPASPFWQRRFYDFNVWSEDKLKEKLDYMHANPVQRQLVTHPKDWRWSSWSYYSSGADAPIRIDSLTNSDNLAKQRIQNPHP